MKDKLETYLGFAIRSGNIVYGVDNIEAKISKIYLIIYDRRLSENGVNKLKNVSKKNQVDTLISEATIDDLINNTIGDSVDNLRFIYTGKSVPDGLKKRIKFNDDLYLLLKERKFKNVI